MNRARDGHPSHATAIVIAAVGTVLVVAYAVLGAVQILVLNPLAAAPGKQLNQIRADLAAADESLGTPVVLGVMGLGVTLAVVVLVLISVVRSSTPSVAVFAYLVLLMLGAPACFIASFGAGMGLADAYMISGGDYAPWARPLYVVSGLAVLGAILIGASGLTRRHLKMPPRVET